MSNAPQLKQLKQPKRMKIREIVPHYSVCNPTTGVSIARTTGMWEADFWGSVGYDVLDFHHVHRVSHGTKG